jgi:AraC-like DNA-binding protein
VSKCNVSRALVRGLFFRLLVFLARQHAQQRTALRDTSTRTARQQAHNVAEVLHFCDEHFCESLSVPQLAAMMFLSPGRFSEVFAREVGMPPATLLRRLRLERAQDAFAHNVAVSNGDRTPRRLQRFSTSVARLSRLFSAPRPRPIGPHTRVEFWVIISVIPGRTR